MQHRRDSPSSSEASDDDSFSTSIAGSLDSSDEGFASWQDDDTDDSADGGTANDRSTKGSVERWCTTPVIIGLAVTLVVAMVSLAVWMRHRGGQVVTPGRGEGEQEETSNVSSLATVDEPTKSSDDSTASSPTSVSTSGIIDTGADRSMNSDASCFPLRPSAFPASGPPSRSRKDWWCDDREMFGFLGFSYPLEVVDCADASNGFDEIDKDLKRMKSEFGASMVRPYGVSCRELSVWENLVRACVENQMGLIVQVWWGFAEDQNLWQKSQSSIFKLFETSSVAAVAPYVVHSASFGSEPIGDGVLGGDFVSSLASFRTKMSEFGVPVAISEDWDRGQMKSGGKVAGVGSDILKNTDVAHLHIMPYYHPDSAPSASDAWPYAKKQIEWARTNLNQPMLVTQSMWSSQSGGTHGRGAHDDQANKDGFEIYWNAFASNCAFLREQRVGWFVHVFDDSQEPYFGMVGSDGNSKIKGWKPERC